MQLMVLIERGLERGRVLPTNQDAVNRDTSGSKLQAAKADRGLRCFGKFRRASKHYTVENLRISVESTARESTNKLTGRKLGGSLGSSRPGIENGSGTLVDPDQRRRIKTAGNSTPEPRC